MAPGSPFTATLLAAFRRELLPLLQRIGFSPAKPRHVRPSLVVALAVADLGGARRVELTLWCAAKTGESLRLRLDVIAPNEEGVELSTEVPLAVPWPDRSSPRPPALDAGARAFLPQEGPERLDLAVTFLAGAFAACAGDLARAAPELEARIAAAVAEPAFVAARARAEALWRGRHLRGEVDPRRVAARVVFVGERLLTVEAEGARHTFHFDTRAFDRTLPVELADWYRNAAGAPVATRLANGDATWIFDAAGQPAPPTP